MNTRLQVEHPVTEMITGLDLVEWQLRVAAGEPLPSQQERIRCCGHAIEVRLYAEDPRKGFLPSTGTLERLRLSAGDGLRVDAGVREGDTLSVYYDPMIAKVISWDEAREVAAGKLAHALAHSQIAGVRTNAGFLVHALRHPEFIAGGVDTGFIDRNISTLLQLPPAPPLIARAAELTIGERAKTAQVRDPWDAQDGFRLYGEARETLEFTGDLGATKVTIEHHRGGSLSFSVDGAHVLPAIHADAIRLASGEIVVMDGGDTWNFVLRDPLTETEGAATAADRLAAPMPGKIVRVMVRDGEKVTRGQGLVVLEAMKMEHTLSAPADLEIARVEVAAGDQVPEGATVVRFSRGA